MKIRKYKIRVRREVEYLSVVTVLAPNPDEAHAMAEEMKPTTVSDWGEPTRDVLEVVDPELYEEES